MFSCAYNNHASTNQTAEVYPDQADVAELQVSG